MSDSRKRTGLLWGTIALLIALAPGGANAVDKDKKYELQFAGSGFSQHDGTQMNLAVVDTLDNKVVKTDSTKVKDGSFSFTEKDLLLPGHSYKLVYYVDMNKDKQCARGDHVWSAETASVTENVVKSVTHDTKFDYESCHWFTHQKEK